MKKKITARVSGRPRTALRAFAAHPLLHVTSRNLQIDADNLELHACPGDTRTRGIVRAMRRLSKFYADIAQQR